MWDKTSSEPTLLWYDYETWGATPSEDRIAQFAAIRTDLELNELEAPINLLCKPDCDTIIDPVAVTITGLSPLELAKTGLTEWDFATEIEKHFIRSGTCSAGYNTIRFDDECTRFLFYRNLIDPYAREWKNGNSRWDLLDVMRMAHALRPEGINWPAHDDGSPSFKLEDLTTANGLSHEQAHDAVSDVQATIALARLLKQHQPKLFEYAFSLRSKHEVRKHLDLIHRKPHLHFTGKIAARESCLGVEVPLMVHPERSNEVIVVDIRQDPSWLLEHDSETIRSWLYSKTEDLPDNVQRPGLRTIHLNRSPMVAPIALLDQTAAERLNVNLAEIQQHAEFVQQHSEFNRLALDIFSTGREDKPALEPEQDLYSGFIDDHDRNILNSMRKDKIKKNHWLDETHQLHDSRLPSIIENVLARHFPNKMNDNQLQQWTANRHKMFESGIIDEKLAMIPALLEQHPDLQALVDTRTYLLSLKSHWFDMSMSDSGQTLDSQEQDGSQTAAESTKVDSSQQLDLF